MLPGNKLLTDAPTVGHKTPGGKVIKGVFSGPLRTDAKSIDPFTWAKDCGFFIPRKHVVRLVDDDIRYSLKPRGAGPVCSC